MAYKDKDKQREANREQMRRARAKGNTSQAISQGNTTKRGKDIKYFEDLSPSIQRVIDMMSTTDGKLDKTIKANRTAIAINYQHQFPNRYYPQDAVISGPAVIGKPGDADYNGVCTEAWRAERGR